MTAMYGRWRDAVELVRCEVSAIQSHASLLGAAVLVLRPFWLEGQR